MGSVSALPVASPRVTISNNLTSAEGIDISVGTGCIFVKFSDTTQCEAFASGLRAQGTRFDITNNSTIRIFYSNNSR